MERLTAIKVVEPWQYEVDGVRYLARKVWHVTPPGPIGCGLLYHETEAVDVRAEDGTWERHVYSWQLHDDWVREHPEEGTE